VAPTSEIRPLRESDDRSSFSCGDPTLDRWFHDYAGPNQFELHLAVSYVAMLGERIVGFATIAPGSLERRELPNARLRRRLPSYPLPILRLARLGVAQAAQRAGIGGQLLRHVLLLALTQRDTLGCFGVVTDAKPNAVAFYKKFGFIDLEVHEGGLHGDSTPMFLAIQTIAIASEPAAE
jgi:GNAT superfamily N-acetyltransferase